MTPAATTFTANDVAALIVVAILIAVPGTVLVMALFAVLVGKKLERARNNGERSNHP